MKTQVYNFPSGKVVGDLDLRDPVFSRPWNPDLVKQALLAQQANRRHPYAHVKGRGEVRGGGKKPWRQKGTGRARHGSIRSPIWIGGGVTHGPSNEKKYEKKINKKMKRAAIFSVLSKKLTDGEIKVVDSVRPQEPKTKILAAALKQFLARAKKTKSFSALLVVSPDNKMIYRVSANLPKVKAIQNSDLNVEDLLKYKTVIIEERAAAEIK